MKYVYSYQNSLLREYMKYLLYQHSFPVAGKKMKKSDLILTGVQTNNYAQYSLTQGLWIFH